MDVAIRKDLIYALLRAKAIQIVGGNNRNITQRAAEKAPAYRARKKGRKRK